MRKFYIVEVEYECGDVDFEVRMTVGENSVLVCTRKSLESARIVLGQIDDRKERKEIRRTVVK